MALYVLLMFPRGAPSVHEENSTFIKDLGLDRLKPYTEGRDYTQEDEHIV